MNLCNSLVVGITIVALILSIMTAPSCHWVRLRATFNVDDVNRNLGIWVQTEGRSASEKATSYWFDTCKPYGEKLVVDSALGMARASTILAPIFAGVTLFVNLYEKLNAVKVGLILSMVATFLALVFQLSTLFVNVSRACFNAFETKAFCTVGLSTWAFWTSIVSSICFFGAFVAAIMQYLAFLNEQIKEENPLSSPGQEQEETPDEKAEDKPDEKAEENP